MQFKVPQFIEQEAKIAGPLTFKQFALVGGAGGISLVLFLTVSLPIFLISTIFLLFIAASFAFIKIGGIPLPSILKNSLLSFMSPKRFIWKWEKGLTYQKIIKIKKEPLKKEEKGVMPKIAPKSKLEELISKMEIKKN